MDALDPLDPLELTVVIVTRNRASVLEGALDSLAAQQPAAGWELVIVDNGSTDHTAIVVQRFRDRLPVSASWEPRPGKSRALNRALDIARGQVVAFTDDDVLLSPVWLREYLRGSRLYPDAAVFCGPIVPAFPPGVPAWLAEHEFSHAAFARFEPRTPEGLLPAPALPFGPNFAIRRSRAQGMRFSLELGPSERGSFMCEDVEFVGRFRRRGEQMIFLPAASVTHRIRDELTRLPVLFDRAFYLGRSLILSEKRPIVMATVDHRDDEACAEALRFESAVALNVYLGELCQLSLDGAPRDCRLVSSMIKGRRGLGARDHLGAAALAWIDTHPEWDALVPRERAGTAPWRA
jgi:glycosyltransferase involved in cell wall biosynthesis